MVSYAELDDLTEHDFSGSPLEMARMGPSVVKTHKREEKKEDKQEEPSLLSAFLGDDDTECNMLVLFFVVGVLLMAITDSLKR